MDIPVNKPLTVDEARVHIGGKYKRGQRIERAVEALCRLGYMNGRMAQLADPDQYAALVIMATAVVDELDK